MTRRITAAAIAALALLAAVAAGCGGLGQSGWRRRGQEPVARRLLDAAGGLRGDHPGLPEDRRTARASTFSQSYGASGDQSRAVEAGLAGRRRRASRSSPTSTSSSKAGLVADGLEQGRVRRLRHQLGRRLRRPQGQPEEHQDLGRPDQARRRGDHAEPVHLGRRAVEHHGRLRRAARAGQVRGAGDRVPRRSCSTTSPVQDKSAREALQTFVGGKGDVLLAYENEAITAQQKGEDVDYVVPDETILIENPIAVTTTRSTRRGQGVRRLRAQRRGAEDLRREGLPPGRQGAASTSRQVPDAAAACSRSTTSAAGRRSTTKFFDPDKGIVGRDRDRTWESPTEQVTRRASAGYRAGAARGRAAPPGAARSAGRRDGLPERDRADPARRRRRRSRVEGGLGGFWDAVTAPQAVAALKLTLRRLAGRGRDQRGHRAR